MKMKRRKFFREIVVLLECGCEGWIHTGRFRVTRDLAALLVSDHVRSGIWCFKHGGKCQPVKYFRIESPEKEMGAA
jgi:hypothetical protein